MTKFLTVLGLICAMSGFAHANANDACGEGSIMTIQGCIDAVSIGRSVQFHSAAVCGDDRLIEVNTGACYPRQHTFVQARKYFLQKMIVDIQKGSFASAEIKNYQIKLLPEYQKELKDLR